MRIGERAQACAVSRDTLRFYEQRGLIAAQRTANGYRDYPSDMCAAGALHQDRATPGLQSRRDRQRRCPLNP
ncbi:transcriptional regulator, MerR family [Pseudomonas chlororaphis subsp. aurantiaca]|nr:transcriptional regulator, MerR family [Pseudomonas chlororaphis subsp. aurantiaca]